MNYSNMSNKLLNNWRMFKEATNSYLNFHKSSGDPNVLLIAVPRGGSSWVMELIACSSGFKFCDGPLNLRVLPIKHSLGFNQWQDLYKNKNFDRIINYLNRYVNGELRFKNLNLFHRLHRFFTNRIVFKVIHGAEWCVDRLAAGINARVVFLLRHPVPVGLSRNQLPRLHACLTTDFRKCFTTQQLRFSDYILNHGSWMQKEFLSWCLQNYPVLMDAKDTWTVITYEQLILEPEKVIRKLCKNLLLDNYELMLNSITIPSMSAFKSDLKTQQILNHPEEFDRCCLLSKWTGKLSQKVLDQGQKILDIFHIDAYSMAEILPSKKYWIKAEVDSKNMIQMFKDMQE